MNRRAFLKSTGAFAVAAGSGLVWAQQRARPLPIIPMTDLMGGIDQRIGLELKKSAHDFGNGAASPTYGINQENVISTNCGPMIDKAGDRNSINQSGVERARCHRPACAQ